ncbi:MAG: excinuclease ABC subunit UvrB [Candidatus Thermoplasmatota archaeon]|nr:excinuclease ABC subunit UvrB [Candidatus Thermoplasmatota archaeon]
MPRDLVIRSKFPPAGDQPKAIEEIIEAFDNGGRFVTLLGVTGSGKTFTVANVMERLNVPTLVLSHNKTLAAQLASEYREFFPDNAVEYFVSYYDYYQPEAYVPHKDLYIEKEADINEEIDMLRHKATQSLMTRKDTIVVSSVSAIFGLGSPEEYRKHSLDLAHGQKVLRKDIYSNLVEMQYKRSEGLIRGSFRARGNVIEIAEIGNRVLRIEMNDDSISSLQYFDIITGEVLDTLERALIFPATHYNIGVEQIEGILRDIERDLEERVSWFRRQDKYLEAERLDQRTRFDLEMIRETGTCSGIENYSRYFDGRRPGEPPYTLLDFFPDDRYLMVIDESHVTVPQIRGMYKGDLSRKDNLVEYGFRLPAAVDNRPLKFKEFEKRLSMVLFTSATPGPYEMERANRTVEQIIRPTGLVDPEIEVRRVRGQIEDLLGEIRKRVDQKQRVLVTTLTKRMAEMLSEHLEELSVKVHYLHSDIKTLDRIEILRDLRLGKYDVLVGINLLREGLDLPEVSLVAILDADKEGFLRSETSLVQTIGRAARHVSGKVIMYADNTTGSMKRAMDETNRRRQIQMDFNLAHGIVPRSIQKDIRSIIGERAGHPTLEMFAENEPDKIEERITLIEEEMHQAASELRFEEAAMLRDRLTELKKEMLARSRKKRRR